MLYYVYYRYTHYITLTNIIHSSLLYGMYKNSSTFNTSSLMANTNYKVKHI